MCVYYWLCRYRLRSKVEIESVVDDFSCWQRFGQYLTQKSSEEPDAASLGWGGGFDRSGQSSSQGNNCGWLWYRDPRLDCLGFRGIFPSNTTRKSWLLPFPMLHLFRLPLMLSSLLFPHLSRRSLHSPISC